MKVRIGFVSNSSSSSFVLDKIHLTPKQTWAIMNVEEGFLYYSLLKNKNKEIPAWFVREQQQKLFDNCWEEHKGWELEELPNNIKGFTNMDNFDFYKYLEYIGVPDYAIINKDFY